MKTKPTVFILSFLLCLPFCMFQEAKAEEVPKLYELLTPEGGDGPAIPIRGGDDAPVVVIEVRSFSCSHCQDFHKKVYPKIVKRYVETGMARWGILDVSERLRLDDPKLFELARCLERQGLYWENQDFFFEYEYQPSSFLAMDAEFIEGVDVKELRKCFSEGLTRPEVDFAYEAMRAKGIKALPTFFIYERGADGAWLEKRLEGALRFSDFEREFRLLLEE